MTSESSSDVVVVSAAQGQAFASQSLAVASTSTSRARLDRLPLEIQLRIFGAQMGLETADHLALRVSCKRVKGAAELAMLGSLTVGPQTTWDVGKLAGVPALGELVRTITFNTRDFGEEEWEDPGHNEDDRVAYPLLEEEGETLPGSIVVSGWRKPVSGDFHSALGTVGRFPNIAGVVVRFSARSSSGTFDQIVVGGDELVGVDWSHWPQNFWFRRDILWGFLAGLGQPHGVAVERGLDICLDNVQNINPGSMLQAEARTALGRLAALRLYIATEVCSGEEYRDLERVEYMDELPRVWLSPAAASPNLTTLVLYQDRPFGFCPRLDLSGVHLPHLKTLALGNFTFSHPQHQLDFFTSHAATLENLYLDHPELIYYSIYPIDRCDTDGYPHPPPWADDIRGDDLRDLTAFSPRLTFADIFSRLESSLPNLVRFSIGRSSRYPINRYCESDEYADPPHPCLHPPHERIKPGVDIFMYRGCHISRQMGLPDFPYNMRPLYLGLTGTDQVMLMGEATDWWLDWDEYKLSTGAQVVKDNNALAGLVRTISTRKLERSLSGGRVVEVEEEESAPPHEETEGEGQ